VISQWLGHPDPETAHGSANAACHRQWIPNTTRDAADQSSVIAKPPSHDG
jgi:hypothetical protein